MGSQWTCGRAVSSGSFAGDGTRAAAADRAAFRPEAHGSARLLSDARGAVAPWGAGRGPESAPESVGRPPRCRGSQRCGSRPRWRPGTRHVSTAVTHPCHCPLLIQAAVTARLLRTPGGDAGVDGAASCRGEGGSRPPAASPAQRASCAAGCVPAGGRQEGPRASPRLGQSPPVPLPH